jgi:serine/threonine protein phosphatase 1
MATIAVGDVHGNFAALDDLLRQLASAVTEGDVVVFLGDYIDRGPNSKECVDSILGFQHDSAAEVIRLCGNHEDWFLRTQRDYHRHSWLLGMEALDTIRSYSVDAAQVLCDAAGKAGSELYLGHCALPYEVFFDCVPQAHLDFFASLRTYYQGPDCVCSHAGLDPRVSVIQEQAREVLIWGTDGFPNQYDGAETVVYGHWNNADLNADRWPLPTTIKSTIGIDTIAHGVLTAIQLPDRRIFQSARYVVDGPNSPSIPPEVLR